MYTLTTLAQGYLNKQEEMYLYGCLSSLVLDYYLRFQVSSSVAIFNINTVPIYRLHISNKYFDAIVARAARLTCTRAEYAALWQQVTGAPWDELRGAADPAERQRLRDELDALAARLYGLTRAEFDHILGTFPLVFPPTDGGRARREALLAAFDAAG